MPKLPGTEWMIPVFTMNSEYRWSIQLDVLFIEGIPYRRLIGINNQKLPPELITFESQKYDRAVATIYTLPFSSGSSVSCHLKYGRGTTVTDTWSLIDGVWHETSAELDWVGAATFSKNIETPAPTPGFANNVEQTNRGKEIITFSNFKKFRTESRILNP
jgi:hypothetical protein